MARRKLNGIFDSKEDVARTKYFAKYYLQDNSVISDIDNIIDIAIGKGSWDELCDKNNLDPMDLPDADTIFKILDKQYPKTLKKFGERGEKQFREDFGADGWSEQLKKIREGKLSGVKTRKTMAKSKCPFRWKKSNRLGATKSKNSWWYGIPYITFIWHGEWADPEIMYRKKLYNATEVEDLFWSRFKEDCKEYGIKSTDAEWKKWMKENGSEVKDFLKYEHYSNFETMNGIVPEGYKNVSKADIADEMSKQFPKVAKSTLKKMIDEYWVAITKILKSGKDSFIRINNVGSFKIVTKQYNKIVGKGKKATTKKATTKKVKFEPSKNFESLVIKGKDLRKKRTGSSKTKTKAAAKNSGKSGGKNTAKTRTKKN